MWHTGRVSDPVNPAQAYPPGWYPDPATPGRDRWWDGQASTRYTAKTVDPAKAMFGVPYVHSMRAGANRVLIATRILLVVGFLLLLFLLFTIRAVIDAEGSMTEYAIACAATIAVWVATIVIGVIGLRRSPTLGGKGVAIWAIATAGALGLLTMLPVLFAFSYRP